MSVHLHKSVLDAYILTWKDISGTLLSVYSSPVSGLWIYSRGTQMYK